MDITIAIIIWLFIIGITVFFTFYVMKYLELEKQRILLKHKEEMEIKRMNAKVIKGERDVLKAEILKEVEGKIDQEITALVDKKLEKTLAERIKTIESKIEILSITKKKK